MCPLSGMTRVSNPCAAFLIVIGWVESIALGMGNCRTRAPGSPNWWRSGEDGGHDVF